MAKRSFRWLLITLALLGVSVDLSSKYAVFRTLYKGEASGSHDLVPGVFQFYVDYLPNAPKSECWLAKMNGPVRPRVNHGALYGLGNNHEKTANLFFATVSFVAAIAIIWWGTRQSTRRDPLLSGAIGLILGGTLGNLFDRIVFGGVRDFLHWYAFDFPVFNVADSCLVCGAVLLLFHAVFIHQKTAPEPVPATEENKSSPTTNT